MHGSEKKRWKQSCIRSLLGMDETVSLKSVQEFEFWMLTQSLGKLGLVSDSECLRSHWQTDASGMHACALVTWSCGWHVRDGSRADGRVWCASVWLLVIADALITCCTVSDKLHLSFPSTHSVPCPECRPLPTHCHFLLIRMRKTSQSRDSKSESDTPGRPAASPPGTTASSSPEQLTDSPVPVPTRSPNRTPSSPESEAGPSTSKGMLLSEDSSDQQQAVKEKVSSLSPATGASCSTR